MSASLEYARAVGVGASDATSGLAFESIVHINEKGGRFGGTEEYIDLLSADLARRGVRSHLICGRVTGDESTVIDSTTVIDGLASRSPLRGTADTVADAVASIDADIVYLHNLFDPAIVATLAERRRRGALVWYVHDHYLTCLSELRWRRDIGACHVRLGQGCLAAAGQGHCVLRYPDRPLDQSALLHRTELSDALGLVDAVIVVSDYMRSLLVDARPEQAEQIHFVSRPIRDVGIAPARTRGGGDPAVISFAGRITPEKGLAILIEALGLMGSTAPIDLRIAGPIENPAYWRFCQRLLRDAVAQNAGLRVSTLGHLDYAGTDDLLRRSDIVAVPSQWPEPLGCIALEAMAAGAAVVASHVGGLPTSIISNDTGLLVPPGDVAAWAGAIDALLDNPDHARRLGQNAQHRARDHNASHHLRALEQVFIEVQRRR